MKCSVSMLWWLALVVFVDGRGINYYPKMAPCSPSGPTGNPLFLTPYIESGRTEEARIAASVPSLLDEIVSFSGYLTVNENYGSNMFFWYFPAEKRPEKAPVTLWLQGGPGASSLFGLFTETGPFMINKDLSLHRRNYSWTKDLHVIYVDNPVGTGFSFTNSTEGYVTNESEVARDLYSALIQFFLIFPELINNEFFVTGESYAGKYIPAISYIIHINNPTASVKINLKGFAIGNGLIDPVNMMKYGDYLYQHGFIDEETQAQFHRLEKSIVDAIKNEEYDKASDGFDEIFLLLTKYAGHVDVYNYLIDNDDTASEDVLSKFLCQAKTRKSIHVGNLTYHDGSIVESHLKLDIMKSVKSWLQVLLEHYRVLLYSGQLDIIVAYPLTMNFVENLKWSGAAQYKNASRNMWFVDKKLAGYFKTSKNFTELLVRDAGHMVPLDQPQRGYEMIKKFIFNIPF